VSLHTRSHVVANVANGANTVISVWQFPPVSDSRPSPDVLHTVLLGESHVNITILSSLKVNVYTFPSTVSFPGQSSIESLTSSIGMKVSQIRFKTTLLPRLQHSYMSWISSELIVLSSSYGTNKTNSLSIHVSGTQNEVDVSNTRPFW
jgi:hypothetical protein